MTPQNTAPPSCRACGHVILVTLTRGQTVERHARCIHPEGPHQQNEFCQWRICCAENWNGQPGAAFMGLRMQLDVIV